LPYLVLLPLSMVDAMRISQRDSQIEDLD